MTKPSEKTREELTAEIEEGKKKIRRRETTGFASAAASWRALCRS